MTFNTLGLSDSLLRAIAQTGYTNPTPIQAQAIPAVLTGKDVMGAAQTGTGKTAGFVLPLLQLLSRKSGVKHNRARALILTPTRELAAQIQESIETYGCNEALRSAVVFGGVNINPQMQSLRRGVDILVATPGRLLDLYSQNAVRFEDLEVLVLDEADRMLDMGFIRDIRKILNLLPKRRQNLLFSATFSPEIRALANSLCHQPIEIDVAPRNSTVEAITQKMYWVEKERKADLLSHLIRQTSDQVLVFSRTKHGANNLVKKLARDSISAAAIHGNKSQAQRTKALNDFKQDSVQVLVATDIAARGIDIEALQLVINYDMPHVAEDYVHRIGRTGRAGASGQAVSLVTRDEKKQLRAIESLIKRTIDVVENPQFTVSAPMPQERESNRQVRSARPDEQRPRSKTRTKNFKKSQSRSNNKSATTSNASPSSAVATAAKKFQRTVTTRLWG
jgi:ATP-dependent RNA helicase RhlE